MNVELKALIDDLLSAVAPDRKLDSRVTLATLDSTSHMLETEPGLDGWDIVMQGGDSAEPDIWIEAADILGVTQSVDAAIELCADVLPVVAPAIILRGLANATRRNDQVKTSEEISGYIAREILVQLICALSAQPSRQHRNKAA